MANYFSDIGAATLLAAAQHHHHVTLDLSRQPMQVPKVQKLKKEKDKDGQRQIANPAFDMADRDSKSERFNNLKPGDQVIITHNHRTGHHDVTGKRAYLNNKKATVLDVALWPNTWLSVRVAESGEKVKVRTSNIMLLSDYESESYQAFLAQRNAERASGVISAPLPKKPRKDSVTGAKKQNSSSVKSSSKRSRDVTSSSYPAKTYKTNGTLIEPPPHMIPNKATQLAGQFIPANIDGPSVDMVRRQNEMMTMKKNWTSYNPCLYCGNQVTDFHRQFCSILCNAQHTIILNGGEPVHPKRAMRVDVSSLNYRAHGFPKRTDTSCEYPILIPISTHGNINVTAHEDSTCPFPGCGYVCDSEQYMADHIAYFHKDQELSSSGKHKKPRIDQTKESSRSRPVVRSVPSNLSKKFSGVAE